MTAYAITIALGSFLLFQVQPMLAKQLLPLFGGSASVWTACLLVFQTLLLAGYSYAHWAHPRAHLLLLAASVAMLPLGLKVAGAAASPLVSIGACLLWTVGLPYITLASTSPLLQRWIAAESGAVPYRLYALSNFGSLLALLSYPFLVEPWLPVRIQTAIWSVMYGAYVFAFGWCAWQAPRSAPRGEEARVPTSQWVFWIEAAAIGSGLLMATTNQMSQEVAPIPFLWVVPLAIYLLTFIICFDRPHWYRRNWTGFQAGIGIAAAASLAVVGLAVPVWIHLLVDSLALYLCQMVCHGELANSRPGAGGVTRYYMAIAAGGALGGVLVAVVAPLVFRRYTEFPLLLAATAMLLLVARYRSGELRGFAKLPPLARAQLWSVGFGLAASMLVITGGGTVMEESRSFYGTLRVTEEDDPNAGRRRQIRHGQTTHGIQYLAEDKRLNPTSYYGWNSAVGVILEEHPKRRAGQPLRAGIIGLGAGTLARYARAGDHFRFYEIDPNVTRMARKWFTYLRSAKGDVQVIHGDARLVLREEPAQRFDVLVVDAFSSDSVPMHLLTAECAEIYRKHLADDGFLAIHISNRTLNLEPVARGVAQRLGWQAVRAESAADPAKGTYSAVWMALHRDKMALDSLPLPGKSQQGAKAMEWTDDFASLVPLLKR